MAPQIQNGGNVLAVNEIWNSVSLEERLELISRSQASGILSSVISIILIGCIAYGFDNISLLIIAGAFSFFTFPIFSSYTWRNGKPSLILAYLAVRTVARRYAYAFDLPNIDIILIYRGEAKSLFDNAEDEYNHKKQNFSKNDSSLKSFKPVWIVLMRSGLLVLSEKKGGAKLEFLTPILYDSKISEFSDEIEEDESAALIEGSGMNKGKSIVIKSHYKGAHYVFEKRFEQLVNECIKTKETIENLRKSDA